MKNFKLLEVGAHKKGFGKQPHEVRPNTTIGKGFTGTLGVWKPVWISSSSFHQIPICLICCLTEQRQSHIVANACSHNMGLHGCSTHVHLPCSMRKSAYLDTTPEGVLVWKMRVLVWTMRVMLLWFKDMNFEGSPRKGCSLYTSVPSRVALRSLEQGLPNPPTNRFSHIGSCFPLLAYNTYEVEA